MEEEVVLTNNLKRPENDYGWDPLGIERLFDADAWGASFDVIAAGILEVFGLIGKMITLQIREGLMDYIFQPLSQKLFYTTTDLISSPGFENLYRFFTRLCMGLLILILLWNAFKLIFGKQSTPFTLIIIKVLAGLAYLQTVPWIIKGIIGFNNLLCSYVIESVGGEGVFAPITNPNVVLGHFLIFVIIFVVYTIRLVFYYFGRDYLITLLTILAPFIWFLWIEDDLKSNAILWFKHMIVLIFTQFVHAIQLAVFSVIILGLAGTQEGYWNNLESIIFSIVSMIYMVRTPSFLNGFVYSLGTGDAASAARNTVAFLTFAKERKLLAAIAGNKFKKMGGK